MHPAFSVIFLTTLIGVGQGMFLALYTGELYSLVELLPVQDHQHFYGMGSGIAFAFLVAGLIASFFHLGHPERAWRAATRWRSSWLSREVIALPAVMGLVGLYGLLHFMDWNPVLITVGADAIPVSLTLVVGALATLMAFVLFVCTGMVYAGVKFIPEWYCALTVANYVLLGGASGFILTAAFSAYVGSELTHFYGAWGAILTVAAFLTRGASLLRNRRIRIRSTLQSATGMRHPQLNQRSMGFMGGSFNTREFFHGKSPATLRTVHWAFLLLVFPLPLAVIGASYAASSEVLPLAAFAIQYVGLLLERWFFFAQSSHPQNLYYQSVA
ncbi:dimethyl sulfoxide reductase anchor subunit family protein [Endothiovibrio diazotrophicus]